MDLYYIISLLIAFSYLFLKSKKQMHMLQQNWYNDGNRYINWVLSNVKKTFLNTELLVLVIIIFRNYDFNLIVCLFIVVYLLAYIIYNSMAKKEQIKKPLVYTPRIKRLYFTMTVIYILLMLPSFIHYNSACVYKYYLFLALMIWLNPLFIVLSNIINRPIEKLVFYHFKSLAKNKLNSMSELKKVGITGSYGKTSCKNALNDILNVKFNSFATERSFNTMNGLMISINNKLDKFTDIFIAEMGAFRRGEIKEKCDFIEPQYGILTTIGTAHLESFGSRENVQKAKFELIDSLPDNGIAVLNMDDEYQISYKIKSNCKKVWVSTKDKKADVYASDIKLSNKGTTFTCTFKDSKDSIKLETRLLGYANIYNIIEAVALAYNLGMNLDQIKTGVKRIATIEHRLELKKYGDINIIDDAYNSNPVGSSMAVDVLKMMDGKKIIVTPGMIELGDEQYNYNMEFGRHIAKVCDEVILIGEEQTKPILDGLKKEKYPDKQIHILNDVKEAFPLMKKLSDKSTYVLLENDLPDIFNE